MPGGVRRHHKGGHEKRRDPHGRWRWGTDTSDTVTPDTSLEKWSLIHQSMGGGVIIGGPSITISTVAQKAMSMGLYARSDY
jgi:hypothetical protein